MILRTTSMVFAAALVAGCSAAAPQSEWQTKDENDAITGLNLLTAERKFVGDAFDAEVVVSCKDLNHLEYKLTVFDKDGQPAPLRTQEDWQWGPYVVYQLRQDDLPARLVKMGFMRFTNQVIFESKSGASGLGAARQIVVRLPLVGGDETYIIDQSDEGLHTVLDPCVTNQQRGIDERAASRAQPEVEPTPAESAVSAPPQEEAVPAEENGSDQAPANEADDTDYQ